MANLITNTMRYGTDLFAFIKSGLLIAQVPLNCTALNSVTGFSITGQQVTGTDRRVGFQLPIITAGSRSYPITTNTAAGDTVIINGITFTSIASGATGNQFNVGASTSVTATNLAATLAANTAINALYSAVASSSSVILTEKVAGAGNTPGAQTTTGTIVISGGTSITSTPLNGWYKLVGPGVATLLPLPTQTITSASLLSEGNAVTDLTAITSIPPFVGQKVTPAIALTAPGDGSLTYPTIQLGISGTSTSNQTSYTSLSPIYTIASQDSTIINATANVTTTSSGTATVTASLKQAGVWSTFQALTAIANQKASAIQFQAVYQAPTIGTSTAQVNSVSVNYRTNNASVSGTIAELMSTTETFPEGMSGVRLLIKHQKLADAQLNALVSFRPQPTQRTMLNLGTGTGVSQTIQLADTGINHNTLQVFFGASPAGTYGYNTALNQITVTAPIGVTIFASYQCGWQTESWLPMVKGSTDTYNYEAGINSTEFTYQIAGQTEQGVSAVKLQLIKPGGTVTATNLGTATGSQQMFVLPHAAVPNTIVLTDGTNPINSWSYDPNSRILTLVATQGKNLVLSYSWTAEIPTVVGFVAAWNQ